jgi:hypothetical protein
VVLATLASVGFAACSSSSSGFGLKSADGSAGTGGLLTVDSATSAIDASEMGGMPGTAGTPSAIDALGVGGMLATGGTLDGNPSSGGAGGGVVETGGIVGTSGIGGAGGILGSGGIVETGGIGSGGASGSGGVSGGTGGTGPTALLRFDGLYVSSDSCTNTPGWPCRYYLRFYQDGTVLDSGPVSGPVAVEQVAVWLKKGANNVYEGTWVLAGTAISFMVVEQHIGSIAYQGNVGQDQMVLQENTTWVSTYSFVPVTLQ